MKQIYFSENLKNLRIAKDLGQQQLAQLLQTTVKSVSHWETGYSEPSLEMLCRIAETLDVSLDELVWTKQ